MSAAEQRAPAPAAIVMERRLPHPPEQVWRMLSDSEAIAKWLMPNDFAPVLGHRFTFRAPSATGWDGMIHCEVLEIDAPRRLRYSWVAGTQGKAGMGAHIDTIVTWTLKPVEGGTVLIVEHAGFGPGTETVRSAFNGGWPAVLDRLVSTVAGSDPAQGARQS